MHSYYRVLKGALTWNVSRILFAVDICHLSATVHCNTRHMNQPKTWDYQLNQAVEIWDFWNECSVVS